MFFSEARTKSCSVSTGLATTAIWLNKLLNKIKKTSQNITKEQNIEGFCEDKRS